MDKNNRIVFAGVIPYRTTQEGFQFLLGEESDGDGWCGFGGGPEEGENTQEAAVREAWEESMGLLGSKKQLQKQIAASKWILKGDKGSNKQSIQYLIKIPHQVEGSFNQVVKYLGYCNEGCFPRTGCYEKKRVKWFKLSDIIQAAKSGQGIKGHKEFFLRRGFQEDMVRGNLIIKE